uniref:WD domain, G-beta repeat, putative n=1 Tax=Theileria annulata TaxID=5874 RepID=A0A3B0N7E6_THEAN
MDVISCLDWIPRKFCNSDFFEDYIHSNFSDKPLVHNEQFFNIRTTDENLLLEDQEDINARKLDESDRVIIAGITKEYFSSLVVYLYDVDTCGLEPNHTIQLSNFPLCSELVTIPELPPLLAVGTFEPEISLYNLKLINQLNPTLSLYDNTINDNVSVLSLSFSTANKLVGGYSDNALRVWDLTHSSIVFTSIHHTKHVQVVLWNPEDDDIILTGSFDQKASLNGYNLGNDIECAIWSSNHTSIFGLENGEVMEYDWKSGKELWRLKLHKKSCSDIKLYTINEERRLITCGLDSKAKVYNIITQEPTLIMEKNLKTGPIFASSISPDDEGLLSFGGRNLVIWDLNTL